MVLKGHVKYFSYYVTITAKPMSTKLKKVVTYYKNLPLIKSQNHLNT